MEPQVLGEVLIEEPERVRQVLPHERPELRAVGRAPEIGAPLAAPVQDHHGRRLVRRREVRRRRVGDVVGNEPDGRGIETG